MRVHAVIVLVMLAAALVFPVAASADVVSYQYRGEYVSSWFAGADAGDPCIQTDVYVNASESATKNEPGKPETAALAYVYVYRYNRCTYQTLISASGTVTLPPDAFQFKKLDSATLNVTVQVHEYVSNSDLPVDVRLTWTGTGEIEHGRYVNHSSVGNCKTIYRSTGDSRPATAVGSVVLLGTNYALEPSSYAYLSVSRQGSADINCR